MNLHDLALKYGCDKLHSHSYIPFYSDLFEDMLVERLLEIGIGYEGLMTPFVPFYVHGASLKMWEEYFPHAQIYSCDIREDTLINEGRIQSWICDQSEPMALLDLAVNKIGSKLDVIIDDGSHSTSHQILSAKTLLPFVAVGGVYVIEDAQEPKQIVSCLGHGISIRFGKRPDDNLVLIQR